MKTETIRGEILGVTVDFQITNEVVGDMHKLTIEYVSPKVYYNARGDFFRVFAPPLKQTEFTERERVLLKLFGIIPSK